MGAVRTDLRLLAAVIAPLLVWQWIPYWDVVIFREGLAGAIILCVSVAVLEEVVFRGGMQGWLLRKATFQTRLIGLSRANWLTSALFAVLHIWQHPLLLVPGYFAVSLVFGYFRDRYKGVAVPVALHVWYNLVLLLIPRFF